ncbi:MAG: DUF5667 domain-containing protein [Chloroflexota bacterium]
MSEEIQDILDECIDRIVTKGESAEECVKDHPRDASELKPLLQVAQTLSNMASVDASENFKAAARYRLQLAMSQHAKRSQWTIPFFGGQPRWVPAVATLLVLFLIGGGTVGAAGNSLPGEPLYEVKLATENVQLVLATSEPRRAMLQASFADNRICEMQALAEQGKPAGLEQLARRFNDHLLMMEQAASISRDGKSEELRDILERNAIRHMAALQDVLERTPQARPALEQAMGASQLGYETAITACGGNMERVRSRWRIVVRTPVATEPNLQQISSEDTEGSQMTPVPTSQPSGKTTPSRGTIPGMGPGKGHMGPP